MLEEENIYGLIPKTPIKLARSLRYKSQYPNNIPPSYSTLCLKTTSKPGVSNVEGDLKYICVSHPNVSASAVFGPSREQKSLSPGTFLKKGVGASIVAKSLDTDALKHHCGGFKQKVPKHDEAPIHGLKSKKNFILSNAVENILAGIILEFHEGF